VVPIDDDLGDLGDPIEEEIFLMLEDLKDEYIKILVNETNDTVYGYNVSGLYDRTYDLIESITGKVTIDDEGYLNLDIYFDASKLKHYPIYNSDGTQNTEHNPIYDNKKIYIPSLLDEGHVQKLWNHVDYPAMHFVENALEKIKEDITEKLSYYGDTVTFVVEKTGGKADYGET